MFVRAQIEGLERDGRPRHRGAGRRELGGTGGPLRARGGKALGPTVERWISSERVAHTPVGPARVLDAIDGREAVIAAEKLEAEERGAGRETRERKRPVAQPRLERAHPKAAEVRVDGIDVRAAALCSGAKGETFIEAAVDYDPQLAVRCALVRVLRCPCP